MKTVNVLDVVDHFLFHGILTDKWHALLYHAQGIHLANYGIPLFKNDIVATKRAVFIPEVRYGHGGDSHNLDDETIHFLNAIVKQFEDVDGKDLMAAAVGQDPWNEATDDDVITEESMKKSFTAPAIEMLAITDDFLEHASDKDVQDAITELERRRHTINEKLDMLEQCNEWVPLFDEVYRELLTTCCNDKDAWCRYCIIFNKKVADNPDFTFPKYQ